MTSLTLLLWIVSGIAVQIVLWLGIGFWRHWGEYQALRSGLRSGQAALPSGAMPVAVPEPASVAAWEGFRRMRVERKEFEDGARSICSFYLVPDDGLPLPAYLPGQFLTFRLDVPVADGGTASIVRCYSLSDAPRPDHYRVSIKRVPAPAGSDVPPGRSSNHFHDHVRVGSTLQVRAPGGHFYLDRGDAPVVLVGGGIGITPVLAMLNWCLSAQPEREIWLYYGVRNSSEVIQRAHLEALAAAHPNFHLRLCFSNPAPDEQIGKDFHHRGRVEVALLRAELLLRPYHFYICGPNPLMESLVAGLDAWGVPSARVHFEAFGPASVQRPAAAGAIAPAGAAPSDIVVTFAKAGKQVPWMPGTGSLLDFAETHGVRVDSGCRSGSCGSCQTTIRSGEVAYGHPPDYDPDPGSCLLCSCTPKTSVTLEA